MSCIEDLKAISISKDFIDTILKNNSYNKGLILDYYYKLNSEYNTLSLERKIENISICNSWWLLDYYTNQKVKDFRKTNLCKDKFCSNCKKVRQANRLLKFSPLLSTYGDENYLYHFTLTVPNCMGNYLRETIKIIFDSFRRLIRYLALDKKIKGLDFSLYSYIGAIRSLEVTFNFDLYHPHLHCIFAFSKPLPSNSHIENAFSYSKKNGYRRFTDFEILIQKIWYLLINKIKVTENNVSKLKLGYSCTVDSVNENSIYEVFKYMTKNTDENDNILTYDNFKVLYFSLHRVKQIQGYGCFYNVQDDDNIFDEVDYLYNLVIETLRIKENPLVVSQTPEDLIKDNENILISRKRIFSYLRAL